jgi:hypothetical protein
MTEWSNEMKFSEVQVGQAYTIKGTGIPRMVLSKTRYSEHRVRIAGLDGMRGYYTNEWREDAKGMYVKVHQFNNYAIENDGADMVVDDNRFDFVRITQFDMTWEEQRIDRKRELEAIARRNQYYTDKRACGQRLSDIMQEMTGRYVSPYGLFDDLTSMELLRNVLEVAMSNPDVMAQLKQSKE